VGAIQKCHFNEGAKNIEIFLQTMGRFRVSKKNFPSQDPQGLPTTQDLLTTLFHCPPTHCQPCLSAIAMHPPSQLPELFYQCLQQKVRGSAQRQTNSA
jgi:hypothetical protein